MGVRIGLWAGLVIVIFAVCTQGVEGRRANDPVVVADTATGTTKIGTAQQTGTITVSITKDSTTKLSLMKYKVEGTVPTVDLNGSRLDSASTIVVMKITAYGSNPPFRGPIPTMGIADQPVQVTIIND